MAFLLVSATQTWLWAMLRISSPENLKKFDRLVEINRRLADPRGLSEAEAEKLAAEGKPFYFIYATIHSTEVSNGQAIIHIIHKLATENSPQIREILDNSVVLMVPSQNPDGQVLVMHDMLGLGEVTPPRFVRQYVALGDVVRRAAEMYAEDVRNQKFPGDVESY